MNSINAFKRYFKRDMQSSANKEEVLEKPNIKSNTSFESFPPRFDAAAERTLTCPTCGGSGKLTQEHENDLVALIPVRDERLKSRKKVYIFIAVLVVILIGGVLSAVFLFPRDVHIKLTDSSAFNITLAPKNGTIATMYLNNTIQINNSNYFDVTLKKISQQVTWGGSIVVADTEYEQHLVVPAKSSINHKFIIKLIYNGKQTCTKMKRACCWFDMLFVVVTQGTLDGLTKSQDVSNKSYQYTECLVNDPDWFKKCNDV
ncbi:transmembrane protein 106B [Exaiptasia diaphana]|uniref:Uncharacterized protein n=1 Tax=Exaiptasia diaphana TaxID=2652724 RepID=A0A913X4D9_EXADI|nr:transmembrane protein 106B [Exaiptasia diaphana]KXJ15328.1 Transmembrane protein 106A [Exaiptasia diaphana]